MARTIHLPGVGEFTRDDRFGRYYSAPISIPVLSEHLCRLVLQGYDDDEQQDDFRVTATRFLSIAPAVLTEVSKEVLQYYQDCKPYWSPALEIAQPADVWRHVHFGTKSMIGRGSKANRKMYVSLECECDWEPEHGLQIVFEEGLKVTKIGEFDGHVTNADAYGDPNLAGIIYHRLS